MRSLIDWLSVQAAEIARPVTRAIAHDLADRLDVTVTVTVREGRT